MAGLLPRSAEGRRAQGSAGGAPGAPVVTCGAGSTSAVYERLSGTQQRRGQRAMLPCELAPGSPRFVQTPDHRGRPGGAKAGGAGGAGGSGTRLICGPDLLAAPLLALRRCRSSPAVILASAIASTRPIARPRNRYVRPLEALIPSSYVTMCTCRRVHVAHLLAAGCAETSVVGGCRRLSPAPATSARCAHLNGCCRSSPQIPAGSLWHTLCWTETSCPIIMQHWQQHMRFASCSRLPSPRKVFWCLM